MPILKKRPGSIVGVLVVTKEEDEGEGAEQLLTTMLEEMMRSFSLSGT